MTDQRVPGGAEILSATLMAAATVASAWCAYRAALWTGNQIRGLAEASAFLLVDVTTFLRYIEDDARGDRQTAEPVRTNARPELRRAAATFTSCTRSCSRCPRSSWARRRRLATRGSAGPCRSWARWSSWSP